MNRPFAKRSNAPRLSAEQAQRQGDVTRLALETLTPAVAALDFLNSYHEGLQSRPLDLAIASAEGLAAVEAILAGLAASPNS